MQSYPDIVVTSPESPRTLIAVEVRLKRRDLDTAVDRLRRYLVRMSCPLGMLVLPDEIQIYRNVMGEESSVQQVGLYHLDDAFPFGSWRRFEGSPMGGFEFERAVQAWLQSLAEEGTAKGIPTELKAALEEHVMPALERGAIRAAHPRETEVAR